LAQWKLLWRFTERWYVLVRSNCKLFLLVAFSLLNMSLKVLVAKCWNIVAYFLQFRYMITTFLFTYSHDCAHQALKSKVSELIFRCNCSAHRSSICRIYTALHSET
jgi:fatty acid desaturase